MKKFACLKPGCRFITESEYESEQHQKQGENHDIYIIETDYNEKIVRTSLDQDIDTQS
jgi:hypothetical protein